MAAAYDSFHMGRCSIDLYSDDIGAPFADITRFSAYVGGSPTNISVGARRLGLQSALLTAVGDDPVGEFILSFLRKEGVGTESHTGEGRSTHAGCPPRDRAPRSLPTRLLPRELRRRRTVDRGCARLGDFGCPRVSIRGNKPESGAKSKCHRFRCGGCTTCRSHRGFRSGSKGEPMARHSVLWGGRAGYDASRGCGGWDS